VLCIKISQNCVKIFYYLLKYFNILINSKIIKLLKNLLKLDFTKNLRNIKMNARIHAVEALKQINFFHKTTKTL